MLGRFLRIHFARHESLDSPHRPSSSDMRDHKSGFGAGPVGSDTMSSRKAQCSYCCYGPIQDFDQQLHVRLLACKPPDIVSGDPIAVSGVASIPVIRSRASAEGM